MKIKSIIAGLVLLTSAVSTMATAPKVLNVAGSDGWNYNFIVRSIRWDANENTIWFDGSPSNATGEHYSMFYIYASGGSTGQAPESGNSIEEAKALFSAMSLARSLNKQIGFQVIKPLIGRYVFSSIHIME
ncbi:MAG: hypothetical protein JWO30_287 [Fibrobacteres bacterium]|nr:hypothetical protein [Fibrobacterota bacterium]